MVMVAPPAIAGAATLPRRATTELKLALRFGKFSLTRAQRELGGVDQLTLVEAEWALLGARDALEAAHTSQFLKYAELQAEDRYNGNQAVF